LRSFNAFALVWLLCLFSGSCSVKEKRPPVDGDVLITIEQAREGPWRVRYDFAKPQSEVDLGEAFSDYRANNWKVESAGVALAERRGHDVLTPDGGRKTFASAVLQVMPRPISLHKEYEPFVPMGDGGVIFYSGHFIPLRADGERMDARFDLIAADGANVSAFAETAPKILNWKSPYRHPAFIYVGPSAPLASDAMLSIVDATAPIWIKDEVATFAPSIAEALQGLLQRTLPARPNIFVAMGDLSEEGRLSYSGDALPGQYQMTLAGGAWVKSSPEALAILRRTTAHEAAHLWQAAARPKSDAVPDWIHEGGADALAAEAMLAAGYWSEADVEADFARARSDCAGALRQMSLQKAAAKADWGAVYACGRILNVAAAGAGGVASFWREFVRRTAVDGYDEAAFLALAEERAGPDAAKAMRDLIRINDARPDLTIERMLK